MLRLLLEDIKDGCLFVVDSCECIVMAYKNQVVSSVVPTFFRHEKRIHTSSSELLAALVLPSDAALVLPGDTALAALVLPKDAALVLPIDAAMDLQIYDDILKLSFTVCSPQRVRCCTDVNKADILYISSI